MIAVIADDFTGAAEIGGIGLRYGLNVVIQTSVDNDVHADLLVIATNTRSLAPEKASDEIKRITRELLELRPDYIYKKLDSVLRGNIAMEILAQMSVMKKKKAIVIAGNPNLGRTIQHGIFSINNTLLHDTSFANDPEFPRSSSSVIELIGEVNVPVASRTINDALPPSGIILGDIANQSDLTRWAERIDTESIPCGSAGFFDELLSRRFVKTGRTFNETCSLGEKTLFVMGSLFPKSDAMIQKINSFGLVRKNMPSALYHNLEIMDGDIKSWADEIIREIRHGYKVVVTIENMESSRSDFSRKIRRIIGRLVELIMEEVKIKDLLIEGGATTYEILRYLGIKKLYPFQELDLGIIQMKVDEYPGLCITTKPGSYSWPDNVEFENKGNKIKL